MRNGVPRRLGEIELKAICRSYRSNPANFLSTTAVSSRLADFRAPFLSVVLPGCRAERGVPSSPALQRPARHIRRQVPALDVDLGEELRDLDGRLTGVAGVGLGRAIIDVGVAQPPREWTATRAMAAMPIPTISLSARGPIV
jgi:hypothetical protein